MTRCRSFLGTREVARPHEQHGFDCRNHVSREQHVELLGAQPKIGKRPFGFDVTDEEEIDGPPQQAHDGQPAVIRLRGGRHELIRGSQALTRVPRREHCVVQQRQTLTEHEWFAATRASSVMRCRSVERAGLVVDGLGCEPRLEAHCKSGRWSPSCTSASRANARYAARSSAMRSSYSHTPPAPIAASARANASPALSAAAGGCKELCSCRAQPPCGQRRLRGSRRVAAGSSPTAAGGGSGNDSPDMRCARAPPSAWLSVPRASAASVAPSSRVERILWLRRAEPGRPLRSGYSHERSNAGSLRRHGVKRELIDLSNEVWQRIRTRIDGLSDAEYFWEPTPGCWSIRQRADGTWMADWPLPRPEPEPFTTIAWRMWHLIDMYGQDRAPRAGRSCPRHADRSRRPWRSTAGHGGRRHCSARTSPRPLGRASRPRSE